MDKALILNKIEEVLGLGSSAEFAKRLGISRQALSNWKSRGTFDTHIVYEKFPELNPAWLLSGEGPILKTQKTPQHAQSQVVNEAHNQLQENSLSFLGKPPIAEEKPAIYTGKAPAGVPYYDVDFIGGFDLIANDQSTTPEFFIDFQPFNDADCWVNVTGKSMSPFISHGDIVALKKFDGWERFLLYGEIYAIITNHFRTIKIVSKGDEKDSFKLVPYSKSPEFISQDIPISEITGMFQVKGSIKKFF